MRKQEAGGSQVSLAGAHSLWEPRRRISHVLWKEASSEHGDSRRNTGPDLKPQSSHSSTGFQPKRLKQMSHLETSNPLEKNRSSGFHVATASMAAFRLGERLSLCRLAPGLTRVKRGTRGIVRIVEPPSVAAVVEGAIEE